jgi:PAS domain S-box-containing protein
VKTYDKGREQDRYYLISTSLIKRKNNKYVLLTIDDITDRKQIETELIVSRENAMFNEKRYSLLNDLTFEGIVLHENRKIIDINKSMIRLTGYSKKELIGKDPLEVFFQKKYHYLIREKLKMQYTPPYEIRLLKKDKTNIPVEIEAYDFKLRENTIRVAAIRDITERKETEKKIIQAIMTTEELQKTKFAQELHDGLGPLLSNVQMYFQWLADEDENKEFVLKKGLESLQTAFSSLREISNNLSPHILHDFGLTKAIKYFVKQIPIKDNQVLYANSSIKENRYNSNIEIALYRVITELINNSRKHANANNIIVNLDEYKKYLIIDFTDDGVGFFLDNMNELQEGHGLVNIKNRIKTLNGEIEINTKKDNGVKFKIKVPFIHS